MNPDAADIAFMALLLILPISALAARRLPVGATVKMALAWLAIFVVAYLLVVLWQGAWSVGTIMGSFRP